MKEIVIILSALFLLTSCGDNSSKSGNAGNQKSIMTTSKDLFLGLDILETKINSIPTKIAKLSNHEYELKLEKEKLLELAKSETLEIDVNIKDVIVPKGINTNNLSLALVDSLGDVYQTVLVNRDDLKLTFTIVGKKSIFNFLGRKKYIFVELIQLEDVDYNLETLAFNFAPKEFESNCVPGYYKTNFDDMDRSCLTETFHAEVIQYERLAVLKEVQRKVNVTRNKNNSSLSLSGEMIQHRIFLDRYEFKEVGKIILTDFVELSLLDLSPVRRSYFSGVKNYDNAYERKLNKEILMKDNKGTYFVDGKYIDKDHFGKNVEYEVLRDAELEIVIFE